jgi:capsid portal protein
MVWSENQFCIKKNKQFKEENKYIQLIDEKNVFFKKGNLIFHALKRNVHTVN